MSSHDPWGDGSVPSPASDTKFNDGSQDLGSIGLESQRRLRRQRARRLILWIGVPILAFVLISELFNLVLRSRNPSQNVAMKATEVVVKQGPDFMIEDSPTPTASAIPAPSSAPATPSPTPSPSEAAAAIEGVEAMLIGPTEVRISWDVNPWADADDSVMEIVGPGLITLLSGYAVIKELTPDTSYEYTLTRRSRAGDSLPVTVVFSTPPLPAAQDTEPDSAESPDSPQKSGISADTGVGLRFRTCGNAAAAGVSLPIRAAEQPDIYYANPQLDRDGDGVACETY